MQEKVRVNNDDALKVIVPPFKYDSYGQMIFDSNNEHVLDIRGWGFLQKHEHGEAIQDSFGELVCKLLNAYHELQTGRGQAGKLAGELLEHPSWDVNFITSEITEGGWSARRTIPNVEVSDRGFSDKVFELSGEEK
jgi:hypothetical protein